MSNRNNITLKSIKQRKQELKAEIDRIETKYSDQTSKIENSVKKALQPMKEIRKKPFKALGVSIGVGFVVGFLTGGSRKKRREPIGYGTGFSSLFMAELKRVAAQRAMLYLSDMLDEKVMPRFKEKGESKPKHDPKDRF